MKRLIEEDLFVWKNKKRRKPLILKGARQVGKTYIIEKFAKGYYKNIVKIDFERNPNYATIFSQDLDIFRIVNEIELIFKTKIEPENTLLFFDEIQLCKQALMSLRYFYEEYNQIHLIVTGSLLDFVLQEISFPVGRVQFLNMYPMGFIEYLWSTGNDKLSDLILKKNLNFSEAIHKLFLEHLKKYFIIGGMPESVKTFIEYNSYIEAREAQEEICKGIINDFNKYLPKIDPLCLEIIFKKLPLKVGKQIKYSQILEESNHTYSGPTIKKALLLFNKAKIIDFIYSCNPPQSPLASNINTKLFKIIYLDIGLIQCLSDISSEIIDYFDIASATKGSLGEQFVGSELRLANNDNIFYWSRAKKNSSAEIDYLISKNNQLFPIEVKYSKPGRMKSLSLFLEQYSKNNQAWVLSSIPYKKVNNFNYIPIYFASVIGDKELGAQIKI